MTLAMNFSSFHSAPKKSTPSIPLLATALAAAAGAVAVLTARAARRWLWSWEGRKVLLTGGSRGLGLALARRLVADGAHVTLVARDAAELEQAQRDLAPRGSGRVDVLTADVTALDPLEASGLVSRAAEVMGGLDALINNAGTIQVGPLAHMQEEDFDAAMRLHFWAPLRLSRAALPHLRKATGGGRIVNVASFGGLVAVPHMAPYSASKHALVGLSRALRTELAADGISVVTVCPGVIRTGSHLNAHYKGRHAEEFDWFAGGMNVPVQSIGAARAARRILDAAREGRASVILTPFAWLANAAEALAPDLTARVLSLANSFLPASTPRPEGNAKRTGWQSRSLEVTPAAKTQLADAATEDLNGTLAAARSA